MLVCFAARYIQYKNEFLADLLYYHLNRDCDNWATWILIVVTQEDNIQHIGDVYQAKYGMSLSDAVLSVSAIFTITQAKDVYDIPFGKMIFRPKSPTITILYK